MSDHVSDAITTVSDDAIKHSDVDEDMMAVVASLTSPRRYVPSWYLYDTRGSELCEEQIQKSKTYKLWQHEYSILQTHADDIVSKVSYPAVLVDLGSGASSKTRLIIEAMLKRGGRFTFVPVDMAKEFIETCGRQLDTDYPGLTVEPFVGLYMDGVRHVAPREEPKLLLWLGSSFGNVPVHKEVKMLHDIRAQLSDKDRLVLGMNMNTDREALSQAYGDQWIPLLRDNLISRYNKDFAGNMDAEKFKHIFEFVENPPDGDTPSYVVKSLSSSGKQRVRVHFEKLGLDIDFEDGERVYFCKGPNTSSKWNLGQLRRLAERSGFAVEAHWTNDEENYCVICLAVADVNQHSV